MNTGDTDRITDILAKANTLRQLNADIQRDYRNKRTEERNAKGAAAVMRYRLANPAGHGGQNPTPTPPPAPGERRRPPFGLWVRKTHWVISKPARTAI